jgi:hypothetical protein
MDKRLCFYVEGQTGILDTATPEGKSTIYGKDVFDFRKEYPGAELVPFDYACERINEALKEVYPMLKPDIETEEQFYEMFECLPPMDCHNTPEGFSFKMSEMTFGNITRAYVRKNGKYYSMNCRKHTKHEELCAVCA